MTTAHDLGAAAGVSTFSVIALGASATGGAAFVSGYSDGLLAAACVAFPMALLSLITIPALRPTNLARLDALNARSRSKAALGLE